MNKIISEEINIENVQLSKKSIKIQTVCQFKKNLKLLLFIQSTSGPYRCLDGSDSSPL